LIYVTSFQQTSSFLAKPTPPDPFTEIIPNRLWTLVAYYQTTLTGANRLVQMGNLVRLQNGDLVLVNAIDLTPQMQEKIRNLGKLTHVITHNHLHNLYIPNVKQAFPQVKVVGQNDHPNVVTKKDLVLDEILPDSGTWGGEFHCVQLNLGIGKEIVLFHKPTQALFITDLAARWEMKDDWYYRFYLHVQNAPISELSSQKYFSIFVKDKEGFGEKLREVYKFDWDKIILVHGRPILSNAKKALRKALLNWGMEF